MELRDWQRKIHGYLKELGNITPLAFVTAFLPMLGSTILLIVGIPLGNWLRENQEIGSLLFTLGTFFFCGLSLLPTNIIGIISGWAFGFGFGIALLIAGVVGAAPVPLRFIRASSERNCRRFSTRIRKRKRFTTHWSVKIFGARR